MPRFAIKRERLDSYNTFVLRDGETGAAARVAVVGATLLYYQVPFGGRKIDITDGFRDHHELDAGAGGRAWIMAPWSNRIAGGRYVFDGAARQVPVTHPATNVALHGFLHHVAFRDAEKHADDASATLVLASPALRSGAFEGYPFDIDLAVAFTLSPGRLLVEIRARNAGPGPAPFGCGWHPYFKTGHSGIDHLRLIVPAAKRVVPDERLLPLPGAAAFAPLEGGDPAYDLRPGRENVIGERVLDCAFCDLAPDPDGWIRTRLEDLEKGLRVSVLQERGLMHVFTGDTLKTRARGAVALEPVEFMTNAFNRPECAEAIRLAPGAERVFRFGIEAGAL